MEAFTTELDRVTRGKPFRIWNDILWMMLLDSRDAHVIHFGSWLKSMYTTGGFFGQLRAHHLKRLPRQWRRLSEPEGSLEARILERGHNEAFDEIFPGTAGPFPTPDDVDALRERFIASVKTVVGDRDNNRAHPFEHAGSSESSDEMLNVTELGTITRYVERVLNRIRLISTSSTLTHLDVSGTSSKYFAETLVDDLLVGHRWRARVVMGTTAREDYYRELHVRHDKRQPEDSRLFNDVWEETP